MAGSHVDLPQPVARQVSSVLRLRVGDHVGLFNGDGVEHDAVITEVLRLSVTVVIAEEIPTVALPNPPIQLALAMIKSDRFEWALQKATELGVDRIIPMVTAQTVISLRVDREERRRQRWTKIVVEAAEQCGRSTLPMIDPVTPYDVLLDSTGIRPVVLWEDETTTPLMSLPLSGDLPVRLIVGPEGGFTVDEIGAARSVGATTVSLGRLTLRAETAAVAAVAILVGRDLARST